MQEVPIERVNLNERFAMLAYRPHTSTGEPIRLEWVWFNDAREHALVEYAFNYYGNGDPFSYMEEYFATGRTPERSHHVGGMRDGYEYMRDSRIAGYHGVYPVFYIAALSSIETLLEVT